MAYRWRAAKKRVKMQQKIRVEPAVRWDGALRSTQCVQMIRITVVRPHNTQTLSRFTTLPTDGIGQYRPSQGVLRQFGAFCILFATQCCTNGCQSVAEAWRRKTELESQCKWDDDEKKLRADLLEVAAWGDHLVVVQNDEGGSFLLFQDVFSLSQIWVLPALFFGAFAWRTDDHEYSLKVAGSIFKIFHIALFYYIIYIRYIIYLCI